MVQVSDSSEGKKANGKSSFRRLRFREFDEDTAINATGALLCWGTDEEEEEASPTEKNYRKRLQRL